MNTRSQSDFFVFRNLTIILFFLSALLTFTLRPIDDCDILTQIQLGYLGLENFVKSEPFIFWKVNQSIPNPGWLSQLTFAILDKWGGLSFVRFTYAVLLATSFTLVLIVTCRSIYNNYSVISYFFGGFFGILIILSNSSARPQGFSLFYSALLFCLYYSKISYNRKLILLALIGILWQNSHPSLPVGILIYGILSLQDFKKENLLLWLVRIFLSVVTLSLCCLLTPDGFNLINISKDSQFISKFLGVSEWQPAWSPVVRSALVPFYFFLFFGTFLISLKKKSFKVLECSFFITFSILTLYAARFSLYLGLMALPLFIKMIEQIRPYGLFEWYPNEPAKKIYFAVFPLLYASIIFGMLYFQNPYSPFFPLQAIDKLRNYPNVKFIFNYREYAGALSYWGDKKWKLFIDGRLYLYKPPIWNFYNAIALGEKNFIEYLSTDYRVDALFLRKSYFSGLLDAIEDDDELNSKWSKIYEDMDTIIFVRTRS